MVRNPYPLTITGNTIQKLEGFQYLTIFDFNAVYYTIRLFPASQYMTTIVTEFGKSRYNSLHMGMCASGDIFQAKVDKIISDIEGFRTYIDDISFLIKETLYNHV